MGFYVPAHRSVRYDDVLNGTAPGARVHPQYSLLRAPRRYLTTFSITPVIVGLANRALDVTTDILRSRLNAGSVPDEFETVQQKIAECAAEAHTANLILDTHLRDSGRDAGSGHGDRRQPTSRKIACCRPTWSGCRSRRSSVSARFSGSRWIYNDHPLQVILRDALAGATHRAFSWEAHARAYSQSIGIERRAAPPIGP